MTEYEDESFDPMLDDDSDEDYDWDNPRWCSNGMQSFTATLPDELMYRVDEEGCRRNLNLNEMINLIVAEWLDEHKPALEARNEIPAA